MLLNIDIGFEFELEGMWDVVAEIEWDVMWLIWDIGPDDRWLM